MTATASSSSMGAAGSEGLHPDLALLESEAAEDGEADPVRSRTGVRPLGHVTVDGVDDEVGERAEVLFVEVLCAAGVRGGLVAVFVDGLEVAAGVQLTLALPAGGIGVTVGVDTCGGVSCEPIGVPQRAKTVPRAACTAVPARMLMGRCCATGARRLNVVHR